MARPAIAGGVLLALMETLADYGTVAYFGVQTFATGIYVSWFGLFDRAAAAQLALCLLIVALVAGNAGAAAARFQRHHDAGRRFERMEPVIADAARPGARRCSAVCPCFFGFLLPAGMLLSLAIRGRATRCCSHRATWGSCRTR
jgi:iron(III) transport system permease protein